MPNTYETYNNYSQRDKESMRTEAAIKSSASSDTLVDQTDQVESLLGDIKTALETVITHLSTIEGKQDTAKGVLDTIATNTTPEA